MSGILHDVRCTRCSTIQLDVLVENWAYPACPLCGAKTVWIPSKMQTDLFPTPQFSDASGQYHSSQREKERYMASLGYYGKGDKHHGARPDLSIKRTAFSYPGQSSRVSTGE